MNEVWSVERLKLFAVVLGGISIPACAAGVLLARLHASSGWYYGVCLLLASLAFFRVMFPNIGIPVRYTELPPRSQGKAPRINPPNA